MTTSQPGGKRLLKSKSGLKMVFQHDREVAPWDLAEPPWVGDEEVRRLGISFDVMSLLSRNAFVKHLTGFFLPQL
jgi:hypothetical protein